MRKNSFLILLSLLGACLLWGCKETEKENILVVSVEPQRYLLDQLVGDKFEVISLLTPGSNPETFEPGMTARQKIDRSQAYFVTGLLPFESKITDALGDDVRIVDTSEGIDLVYGTHGHSHSHGDGHKYHHDDGADPHIWTSVRNARQMAGNMYRTVVEIDPTNEDFYTERYNKLTARLDSLDSAYKNRFESQPTPVAFAIWHPSLSYLARDYRLEQIAVGFENKEMPVGTLRKIIEEVKEDSVKVFFFQKEFDSRQATTLNKEMGTELVTINPLDYEWQEQLDNIVSALCR